MYNVFFNPYVVVQQHQIIYLQTDIVDTILF